MKIFSIVGARPQFVKAAVISRAIARFNQQNGQGHMQEVLIHTGQHYHGKMSDLFFQELELPEPRYNLGIHHERHGAMTGRMIEALEDLFFRERPDVVVVYGDTNSTLAGALAASKLGIPIAHVEAGMRSFIREMPEEINRVVTDSLSTFLFCPTETSMRNLEREGMEVSPSREFLRLPDMRDRRQGIVIKTGDVMFDAFLHYRWMAKARSRILGRIGSPKGQYILATVHRAENTDNQERLSAILDALNALAREFPVVWPLHPRTEKALKGIDMRISPDILLLEPLGYLDMITLETHASLIVTDSGGVQREAYFSQVPCVILREETEWPELIEAGCSILAGADTGKILSAVSSLLDRELHHFYWYALGDGKAGDRIVSILGGCLFGWWNADAGAILEPKEHEKRRCQGWMQNLQS